MAQKKYATFIHDVMGSCVENENSHFFYQSFRDVSDGANKKKEILEVTQEIM